MKKALSLILAVVIAFSMTTVAFAASNLTNKCDVCGFMSDDIYEFTAHRNEFGCKVCKYCGVAGLKNADEIKYHEYECKYANIFCDYCGGTKASERDYFEHIDACKEKYFYIPLALIIEHVKTYVSKIDFKKAFNDGKSFVSYVIVIITDIVEALQK